jgi:hypothetical protein
MKAKTIIGFLICISFFTACEEIIDDTVSPEQSELLVVEGLLTNEKKNHKVKLTLPYSYQNNKEIPATGAFVAIINSDTALSVLNEFPKGSGEYYTDSLRAVFGKFYLLFIRYKGKEYRAFDFPPPGERLNPLIYKENIVDDQSQYNLEFEDSGTSPNYINYDIDWSDTDRCTSTIENCKGELTYYDLKTIDVQEIYAPEKLVFFFPSGSRIIRKKFSVSDNYQKFLRSLLSETEWRGGLFDVERDNITTNLSEGAIGFFAVTTVVTDTVFVY